jgi:fructokinase
MYNHYRRSDERLFQKEKPAMILCCGEALVDFVPIEGSRPGYQPVPGGSSYNTSVALSRLGVPVGFFSKISTDFFGEMLVKYLQSNEVDTGQVLRSDEPTTLAFVSLPEGEGAEPQFAIYANGAADRSLRVEELPGELPLAVHHLHFGSISLVLEPGASAHERLMEREKTRCSLSLDPNIRPALIPDRQAYRRRFESWLEMVNIVRLSLADLEWLYPDQQAEAIARSWVEGGLSICVLTKGSQGALAFTSDGSRAEVRAPAIQVVDTVGAGDTFAASVLAYLYEAGRLGDKERISGMGENELQECLAFASQAAAINCTRPGADPPYRNEL